MFNPRIVEIGPLFDSSSVSASLSNSIRGGEGCWNDLPASYPFSTDLHGFREDEIKVQTDGRVLQIGLKEIVEGISNGIRVQDRCMEFWGKFRLPENAKAETVRGTFDNGVLTVTCGKERATRQTNV